MIERKQLERMRSDIRRDCVLECGVAIDLIVELDDRIDDDLDEDEIQCLREALEIVDRNVIHPDGRSLILQRVIKQAEGRCRP